MIDKVYYVDISEKEERQIKALLKIDGYNNPSQVIRAAVGFFHNLMVKEKVIPPLEIEIEEPTQEEIDQKKRDELTDRIMSAKPIKPENEPRNEWR